MADFTQETWVDDDGTLTLGTRVTAARLNRLERGVKDAAQDAKQSGSLNTRPPASAATKNWLWRDPANNDTYYCDGSEWHWIGGGAAFKESVYTATKVNVTVASAPTFIGGIAPPSGERVLLAGQTNEAENGVYLYSSASGAMQRARDFDEDGDVNDTTQVHVASGAYRGETFAFLGITKPDVGTDALRFEENEMRAFARARKLNFSVPNNQNFPVQFLPNEWQDVIGFKLAANGGALIPEDLEAYYLVTMHVAWSGTDNGVGARELVIQHINAAMTVKTIVGGQSQPATSTSTPHHTATIIIRPADVASFNAFTWTIFQNSGAAKTCSCDVSVVKIRSYPAS